MEQWCILLWILVSSAANGAAVLVSWALDNVARFAAFWEKLPAAAKKAAFFGLTLAVGFGAYAAGSYVFSCADWPPFVDVAYVVLMAAVGYLSGKSRHEREKRTEAEVTAAELHHRLKWGE